MAEQQRAVGAWLLEGELGRGSFAVVWRARHATTGAPAAVKEINTDKLNKKLQESLASEVAVLSQTKHGNVVGLLDLLKDGPRIYIVLEYCAGGDLGRYIRRYGRVSEATARYFLLQLAEGLKELRRHNVIHRDLKPQNLLLSNATATPLVKIADFGFARSLAPQGLAETLCGSPLYMAPEILQFQKYDAKADLWSVGTILFELLTGRPPFNGTNHVHLLRNIERSEARLPEHIATRLSGSCRALVGQLLKRNPVQRLTFEEFFQHPFLTGAGGDGPPLDGAPGGLPAPPPYQLLQQGVPPPAPLALAPNAAPPPVPSAAVWRPPPAAGAPAATLVPAAGPAPPAPGDLSSPAGLGQHQQQQQRQRQEQPQQQQPAAGAPQQAPRALQPAQTHPLQGSGASGLSDSFERDYVVIDSAHSGRMPRERASGLSGRSENSAGGGGGGASASAGSSALVSRAEAFLKGDGAGLANAGAGGDAGARPEAESPSSAAGGSGGAAGGGGGPAAHAGAAAEAGAEEAPLTASGLCELEGRINKAHALTQLLRALLARLQSCTAAAASQHQGPGVEESQPPGHTSIFVCSLAAGSTFGAAAAAAGNGGGNGCGGGGGNGGGGAGPQSVEARIELLSLQLLAMQLLEAALCSPDPDADGEADGEAAAGAAALLFSAAPDDARELASIGSELLRAVDASLLAAGSAFGCDGDAGGCGGGAAAAASAAHAQPWATASMLASGHGGGAAPSERPLPDAYSLLYDDALGGCRAAAVEELLAGPTPAAAARYALARAVLLFLSLDWRELGPAAAPGLAPEERLRVYRLYAAVSARAGAGAGGGGGGRAAV
ncbi:hypothetical protein Rsub_00247 [Raphidocelis subcapitata]|uniref:Protein kinase domain-containing protein n=1 Tax=Raphidocelis subcapitata TaxID=307507 RepID=A0A2V0NJV3_9CHLO|nr:hypothetical protein Rsub_00247 [Raphidocelis subcapitata]|eukprot:GBF87536.1 hypothetical protein Rsub_00247 [Raphidocelis subcapitata]